jgi:exopolyphosphatase/guanosine-5'-triphosphate,3'-diphosphate pyrophosphatase
MSRIAVIDIGTNNFHLLIAEKRQDNIEVLHKSKVFAFIGRGGIHSQMITPEAMERALEYLQKFKEIIDNFQCEEILAIATSAVRNALNGKELVEKVKAKTGIPIQVIDGEREAELIYYGVRSYLVISATSLIMDIGGGSVEFILCDAQKIYWKQSFEIGAQRLLYDFHQSDPISIEEIEKLNAYLEKTLQPLLEASKKFPTSTLIGSAGSFDTIVDIYCAENQVYNSLKEKKEFDMPMSAYKQIHQQFINKNLEERLKIEGMTAQRAEMIVVASCLIDFVVNRLAIKQMRVSAASLKEGVLWEWASKKM